MEPGAALGGDSAGVVLLAPIGAALVQTDGDLTGISFIGYNSHA